MSHPVNLLQLRSGSKFFGNRSLFEDANFSVNENEHIGVIGPNGAGKTTLFRILSEELELDSGEFIRSGQLRMGYLQQHEVWKDNQSVEDYLEDGASMPLWEMKKLATGLGLSDLHLSGTIQALSGGYRMRVKLLKLLGMKPNLMLLDEPTNYLDLETTIVLEDFLQDFEGSFLLISHDREFLRKTTDHILEIEAGDFTKYNGNIDDYFEQKQMLREQLEKQAMSVAAKKAKVLEFAAKFGAKASKAKQAQSRLKQASKMETIELKPLSVGSKIYIPEPQSIGRLAMEIKDADFGYGEKVILQKINLQLERGDHLGIVGYNGAGKSTLLKSLAKELPPLFGKVEWGYEVSVGYYAQHVAEALDPSDDVIGAMSESAHPSVKDQEVLNMAGSLLFSGNDARKKISVLSGGEKARVAFGKILLQKSPVLLLDEPTNHLDFYTVEALTQALHSFRGTVIVVSHDRGFVKRVANKILEVNHGQVLVYPGSYDEYVWRVQQAQRKGEERAEPRELRLRVKNQDVPEEKPVQEPVVARPRPSGNAKTLEVERRQKEKELKAIELKMSTLEKMLGEQTKKFESVQGQEAQKLSIEVSAIQNKVSEIEVEYMQKMEEVERLKADIKELKGQ